MSKFERLLYISVASLLVGENYSLHAELLPISSAQPFYKVQDVKKNPIIRRNVKEDPIIRQDVRKDPIIRQDVKKDPIIRQNVRKDPIIRQDVRKDPIIRQDVKKDPIIRQDVKKNLIIKNEKIQKVNQAKSKAIIKSQKTDQTPLWLKIDHVRLTQPKQSPLLMINQHPFKQALAAAYNLNPQIKSNLRQYYGTAENLSKAMGGWRPSVTGEVAAGYSFTDDQDSPSSRNINIPRGKSSKNPKTATLNVTQNLYQGGGTLAGIEAAENQIRAARADFLNTEQKILLNAVQAYLDLWFQIEKLKVLQDSEKFYKESLNQTQAQHQVGESSITDLAQAKFSYQTSEAKRRATESDIRNAKATYRQVVGEESPKVLILPAAVRDIMEFPKELGAFLEAVKRYNPTIIKAEYDYASAQNNVDVATAQLLPSVDLSGSADRTLSSVGRGVRTNDASVTVRLKIPFYNNGGGDWANVRQREQGAIQSKHDVKTAFNAAVANAEQAWENSLSNKKQIADLKLAVEAGDQRTKGTGEEVAVGERPILDALQAKADVETARISLLQAQRDYLYNEYALIATIGELTPPVLDLPVMAYDLNTYPESVRDKWLGWEEAATDSRGIRGKN